MKLNIETILAALPALMSLVGQFPAIIDLINELVASFSSEPSDQAALQARIAELSNENDEGHKRLQAKLAAAAQQTG